MYRRVLARAPLPRSIPALALSALPKPLQTKLQHNGCKVQFVNSHTMHKSTCTNQEGESTLALHKTNVQSHKGNSHRDNEDGDVNDDNDDYNYDDDDMIDGDSYGTKKKHHHHHHYNKNTNCDNESKGGNDEMDNSNNHCFTKTSVIYPLGYKAGKGEAAFAFTPFQRTTSHNQNNDDDSNEANHLHQLNCKDQMIVAGLGNRSSCTVRDYRLAVTNAVRLAKRAQCAGVVFDLNNILPYSGNSEHTIAIATEQDLFHKPQPLKEDEIVEKTACFAVTGAYNYNRLKTLNEKEGNSTKNRKGSGNGENDDLYGNDGNADGYDDNYYINENNSLSSTSASKRNIGKSTRGGSKSGRGKSKTMKYTRGSNNNKKKPTRKSSMTTTARRNAKTINENNNRKGNHSNDSPFSIIINSNKVHAIQTGSVIGSCVNDCRNLGNLREDEGTPEFYAQWSQQELIRGFGSKDNAIKLVKLLRGEAIRTAGLNLLYSVGKGSSHEPYVLVLEYTGNKHSSESISLVGKGVTFDCGGLNIKPYGSMETMHTDMMGAATALCTLKAAATLQLPVNLSVAVGFVENAIGPNAYSPSSILTSLHGQTVEIRNTDAEGRLVLADLLTYIQRGEPSLSKTPTQIIDLATLTGAIVIGLGERRAGLFSNHLLLTQELMQSGMSCGEELWPMPIGEEHVEKMKRTMSDWTNAAVGRAAGSCTAAAFLSQFIEPLKLTKGNSAQKVLAMRGTTSKQNRNNKKKSNATTGKGKRQGRPRKTMTTTSRKASASSKKQEDEEVVEEEEYNNNKNNDNSNDGTHHESVNDSCSLLKMPKWAHLDIAGVADVGDKPKGFEPAGVSGFGVQLLVDYIRKQEIAE